MRNIMIEPEKDEEINARNRIIIQQDVKVLTELHPVITPPTNTKEFMMPADKVILMYREILKEYELRGWRLDVDAINASDRGVAYAIPSPARREHKGWVLDAAPLLDTMSEQRSKKTAVLG
jgi:hypothetical protein